MAFCCGGSFWWLSVFQCLDGSVTLHFSLLMDILVEVLSWNWWIVLPWKQRRKYHFKLLFYPDLREGVGLPYQVLTIFSALRNLHTVFLVAAPAPSHFHPRPQYGRSPGSPCPRKHWIFVDLLEDGHSEGVNSLIGISLTVMLSIFSGALWPSRCLLWRTSI